MTDEQEHGEAPAEPTEGDAAPEGDAVEEESHDEGEAAEATEAEPEPEPSAPAPGEIVTSATGDADFEVTHSTGGETGGPTTGSGTEPQGEPEGAPEPGEGGDGVE